MVHVMDKGALTRRDDWTAHALGTIDSTLFADVFGQYLQRATGGSCLEIGCMPGGFLAYLCKTFGYTAHGIDFGRDARRITEQTLRANGILDSTILEQDVITWKPTVQHDLVCSFGFIEHFTGEVQREIFKKHVDALKPGGRLIVEVPNFNYGQYVLHRILDKDNLRRHNVACMKPSFFRDCARENGLRILHLGYYGGFIVFWHENERPSRLQLAVDKLVGKLAWRLMRTPLKEWNNRFFSPFLIMVAQKP